MNVIDEWLDRLNWEQLVERSQHDLRTLYESDRDRFWMRLAYLSAAEHSDDPATQNGAVIVTSWGGTPIVGANRFPRSIAKLPERLERPRKYQFVEHAERFAILSARVPLDGAVMYSPWSACAECARAIILSGISDLVGHQEIHDRTPERWKESIEIANQMLDEAGVKRRMVSGKIGGVRVLFDGQYWEP